ncbi:MAG: hypothetical protein PHY80_06380 [Rickettsiales bacterium]|nr:hypothetical protein [Rickettsiales bacterium]
MSIIKVRDKILFFLKKIKNEILLLSDGKAKFNYMLYLWGLTPAIVITFFFQKQIDSIKNSALIFIVYLLISLYFLWHLFVIRKTLKVQPEYKRVKLSNRELFKDKTKEEIEAIKKDKRKSKFRKLILLEGWESTPPYIMIACFDTYVALTQIQGMFNIF